MIKQRVENFINKYNLAGTFLVAFSGGYDSMCLLDVLSKISQNVVAIHLNHNWRGEESKKEENNCRVFAKSRNIKFYAETLPENVEKTETAAREARYEFFRKCAEKFNSKVIFTAHNFDDNAETVLYRIIKGTGTIGLQGISEQRENFYRPLLSTSRAEIEQYIIENGLSPNNDSSNLNTKYKRNLIRHKIIPLLQEINPNVKEALNSLSQLAREENELINKNLSDDIFNSSPIEQKRIIYNLLVENKIDYDKDKIENIQKFVEDNKISKSGKTLSLTDDLWLFVNNKNFEIISRKSKNIEEIHIEKCGTYDFDGKTLSVQECDAIPIKYPEDKECIAYINVDKIDFTLRHRKNGDRIHPLGAKGSQKLKKYLNEKKIPQHKKDELFLLCDESEVLWVAGIGISENIKVVNKPTHMLTLR